LNQTDCQSTNHHAPRRTGTSHSRGNSNETLGLGLDRTGRESGRRHCGAGTFDIRRAGAVASICGLRRSWSGNGTVSLSDGSTERLRCRAEYKIDNTGLALKQTLKCASDSYKFDLNSSVTSQGGRISGEWNESNRNIFGSLQGTAGSGKIDVLVEAPGFTAKLSDIRGVSITMVKS
jgi:hypothetical protein